MLENAGDEKFLNLKTREVFDHPDPKTSEIGTDAPGRSFSSVGHGRSAMEQTDWHTQEEERFLQKLAGHLDAEVKAGQAKSMVIVAPPRALGVLRPAYTHDLRKALQHRDRQGPREDAGARDREAPGGVNCGVAALLLQQLADVARQDRLAILAERADVAHEIAHRLARADFLRIVGGEHDAVGRDFDQRRSSPT